MRRSVLLLLVVAVAALIFAPVVVAQDDNPSADDRGADDRSLDEHGFEDNGGGRGFAAGPQRQGPDGNRLNARELYQSRRLSPPRPLHPQL